MTIAIASTGAAKTMVNRKLHSPAAAASAVRCRLAVTAGERTTEADVGGKNAANTEATYA